MSAVTTFRVSLLIAFVVAGSACDLARTSTVDTPPANAIDRPVNSAATNGAADASNTDARPSNSAPSTNTPNGATPEANAPDTNEPVTPAPLDLTDEPALALTVTTDKNQYDAWERGSVTATVTNTSRLPAILRRVRIAGPAHTVMAPSTTSSLFGRARGGTFTVSGTHSIDDVGAEARLPEPPRWTWVGLKPLVTYQVLVPGASLTYTSPFRARYDATPLEFTVEVTFAEHTRSLLVATQYSLTAGAEADGDVDDLRVREGHRVVDAKVRILYGPAGRTDIGAAEFGRALRFASADGAPGSPRLPADFTAYAVAFGLDANERDGLVDAAFSVTADQWAIARPAFDISDARRAGDLTVVRYTRALLAGVWVIAGDGESYLVSARENLRVPGDVLPLADALNENSREIIMFRQAIWPDPDGVLAAFEAIDIATKSTAEKNLTYTGSVRVRPADFVVFLKKLTELGLTMWGVSEARYAD